MTLKGVIKCFPHLRALINTKSAKKRRSILRKCPRRCIYYAISEIIKNVLNGNLPIPEAELNQLRRYKEILRELSKKSISLRRRETLINQRGGFLPSLLLHVLPILASQI